MWHFSPNFLFTLNYEECRSSSSGSAEKEKTFAMIKPDGLSGNYADEIKNAILESGFIILREMTVRLDEDTAGKFYAEHSSRSFFPALVKYMTRYLLPDINSCYFFYSKYYWLDRLYCLIKVDNYCSHHKFHISSLN